MEPHEIQAKATIAAALITSGTFTMNNAAQHKSNPMDYPEVDELKDAVNEIYRVLNNG